MLRKIKNIIIGWFNYLFKPMPKFAKNRYEICKRCSYRKIELGYEYCSLCGCALPVKCFVPEEFCDDKRW